MKLFVNHISDKGVVSRVNFQLDDKNTNKPI